MYSPSKTGLKILDAFQTLYESATGYGLRKALNTKKDELEDRRRWNLYPHWPNRRHGGGRGR